MSAIVTAMMPVIGRAVSVRMTRRMPVRAMRIRRVAIPIVAVARAVVRTAVAVSAKDQMPEGMTNRRATVSTRPIGS